MESEDLIGEASAHDSYTNDHQGGGTSNSAAETTPTNDGTAAMTPDASLASLLAMGFSEDCAREALRATHGNCDEVWINEACFP
jgi:Holliday junction resolvasome RuvABC DNA-binding subunit